MPAAVATSCCLGGSCASNPSPPPSPPPCLPRPQEFPSLLHPLITERDQFMAFMLRKLASRAQTVVAVVGAGHLQGIRCVSPLPAQAAARRVLVAQGCQRQRGSNLVTDLGRATAGQ